MSCDCFRLGYHGNVPSLPCLFTLPWATSVRHDCRGRVGGLGAPGGIICADEEVR